MRLDRVMIAAPKSGSGKTTITCGLLQALINMGLNAVSYKCGPDYIDPMFHRKVLGVPSKNLDTFFTGEEETKALLVQNRKEGDFAVLEGVMGLYDGLGGVREEGSSYHLARVTGTPIILTVDAKGMGRSVIPMIAGFLAYDTKHLIKGVILNRMSAASYETLRPLIEKELPVSVLGYFPERRQFQIESRHLGLIMPDETEHIKERLQMLAEELKKTIAVREILQIGKTAGEIALPLKASSGGGTKPQQTQADGDAPAVAAASKKRDAPVIAVASDEAFCFYYEDNLRLLEEYGAKLVCFSPLRDQTLPAGCSGLLLGGGYPELYAGKLEENSAMRTAIRKAIESGMPTVAECGGFLYLHDSLKDREGKSYAMVGAIPAQCHDAGKLVRFGYIELEEREEGFLPKGERIRGHEFHYYDSENNGGDCLARKPVTGKTYACVTATQSCFWGFPHLYYPSNPHFAKAFVKKAAAYRER